jgi:DNA-binding NarL/FixJ family response regulator
MEVLDLIARGFTNSDIARILEISRDTVKGYVKGVYEKLDVSDRVTATTEAYRRGFLRRD